MQPCFLSKECVFVFFMFWVWDTAIDRTNRRTLWFFMETHALCTLVGHNVIKLV
jgi:hypothetical protein